MKYIYQIKNTLNNKVYIGQTNNIKRRWDQHKSDLKRGVHDNPYLQKLYNKYGLDIFEFGILHEEDCDQERLN